MNIKKSNSFHKYEKLLYITALLFVFIGICLSFRFSDVRKTLRYNYNANIEIPGKTELYLPVSGHYKINVSLENVENTNELRRLNVILESKSGNSSVPIDSRYISPRRFFISAAGTYTLSTAYDNGTGPSATADIEIDIFKYPVIGYPCVFIGLATLLMTHGIKGLNSMKRNGT
jgi:hypothetical protein